MDPEQNQNVEEASPSHQQTLWEWTPWECIMRTPSNDDPPTTDTAPSSGFHTRNPPSSGIKYLRDPPNISDAYKDDWRKMTPILRFQLERNASSTDAAPLAPTSLCSKYDGFHTPENRFPRPFLRDCPSPSRKKFSCADDEAAKELKARREIGVYNFRFNPFCEKLMPDYYTDVYYGRGGVDMDYPATGTEEALRFKKDFLTMQTLGKGASANVFQVLNRVEGCYYAMKKVHCDPLGDRQSNRQALIEVQALASLGAHDHIVRYYNSFYENEYLFIQLELCARSLKSVRLNELVFVSEEALLNMIYQIGVALEFIHRRGIIHIAVSPQKIMVSWGMYKLGGFRHAARKDMLCDIKTKGLDSRYAAPEILHPKQLDVKLLDRIDIYSLGVTVYTLANGFEGKHTYSSSFQRLVKTMTCGLPSSRPTAKELLKILREDFKISSARAIFED